MNSDELLAQMEADERADQAELGKMSPREYAKMKGLQPQLVYYYIRNGHIRTEPCVCGRTVIDVQSADSYLQAKEEAQRKRLGTSNAK